jgi:hypothetical protein
MIYRLARAYVIFLATVGTLVLVLTFALHLRVLVGSSPVNLSFPHIFLILFGIAIALLGLAKERNIWANEVKVLPKWVRLVLAVIFVYSMSVIIATILMPGPIYPAEDPIAISAFFCMYLSVSVCIPFALLQPGYVDAAQLNKRVATSLGFLAVGIAFLVLSYTGVIPRPHAT